MKPEQLYQKLQPLFRQLNVPDTEMNPHGYYSFPLESCEIFLEMTEINTLVMIAFLPMNGSPGEDMLLELLQANLTPDHDPHITIALDKEENKLVLWGSLREDEIYLEKLFPMLEKLNLTVIVIARWLNKEKKEEADKSATAEKNKMLNRQAEQFLQHK